LDDGETSSTQSLTVKVSIPANDNVISQPTDNGGGIISNPVITPTGTVQGGTLGGQVQNQGTIRDVALDRGTVVTGGTLGGEISGDPASHAHIRGARIESGALL